MGDHDDNKDAEEARDAFFGSAAPLEESKPKTFGILLENVEALNWFMRMQTQWRVSMNGPIGLDYGVFLMWSKEEQVKRKDRVWLLEDLRLLEGEYLSGIRLRQDRGSS
jgi:hypothetical protein